MNAALFVEEGPGEGDDFLASLGIVGPAAPGVVGRGNGVGAVERIVEVAPTRIGDCNDQLWAGDSGDPGVDFSGACFELAAFG